MTVYITVYMTVCVTVYMTVYVTVYVTVYMTRKLHLSCLIHWLLSYHHATGDDNL